MKTADFERFSISLPDDAVEQCNHSGSCDADVEYWAGQLTRPSHLTPEKLRAELKEYGAWDEGELADDAANWHRIIWIAAGRIQDEEFIDKMPRRGDFS